MDAEAVVLGTGTLNLRRFEKRPNELLVLEDLLDRRVTIEPEGTMGNVVDLAMELNRNGEWLISRVAVREHSGRLTRRAHVYQVEYDRIRNLFGATDTQGTSNLLALLEQMRPADMANALQDLPDARRNEVAAALTDRTLADVLEELPEHDQVEILARLDRERAADVLERMDPDDAADLLAELPKSEQTLLLDLMEPDEADSGAATAELLAGYGRQRDDLRAGDPHAGLHGGRGPGPDPRTGAGPGGGGPGVRGPRADVHPEREVPGHGPLPAPAPRAAGPLLGALVDDDLEPLRPETDLAEITKRMATYDMVAMPVVDSSRRLVGAVTVDDVLDHSLPRDWRDRAAADTEAAEAESPEA